MVREVSLFDIAGGDNDPQKIEALNKIAEALETLSRLNVQNSDNLSKSIKAISAAEIDVTPLAKVLEKSIEKPLPPAYLLEITKRDGQGRPEKMVFRPLPE